jgi:hypothetical protein
MFYRVWWTTNPPGDMLYIAARNIEEARAVLDCLVECDDYLIRKGLLADYPTAGGIHSRQKPPTADDDEWDDEEE